MARNPESQQDALKREWLEELGLKIDAGQFLFCGESVPPHGLRKSQVLQIVFKVDKIYGEIELVKDGPLVDFTWVKHSDIGSITFFPGCTNQIKKYLGSEPFQSYERYDWLN